MNFERKCLDAEAQARIRPQTKSVQTALHVVTAIEDQIGTGIAGSVKAQAALVEVLEARVLHPQEAREVRAPVQAPLDQDLGTRKVNLMKIDSSQTMNNFAVKDLNVFL